jgi:hypothetical protein
VSGCGVEWRGEWVCGVRELSGEGVCEWSGWSEGVRERRGVDVSMVSSVVSV